MKVRISIDYYFELDEEDLHKYLVDDPNVAAELGTVSDLVLLVHSQIVGGSLDGVITKDDIYEPSILEGIKPEFRDTFEFRYGNGEESISEDHGMEFYDETNPDTYRFYQYTDEPLDNKTT